MVDELWYKPCWKTRQWRLIEEAVRAWYFGPNILSCQKSIYQGHIRIIKSPLWGLAYLKYREKLFNNFKVERIQRGANDLTWKKKCIFLTSILNFQREYLEFITRNVPTSTFYSCVSYSFILNHLICQFFFAHPYVLTILVNIFLFQRSLPFHSL